jgi:hypothetical protein
VSRLLPQDVKETLEVLLIKLSVPLTLLTLPSIAALEDDKRLKDQRLATQRRRTEDRTVGGAEPPSEKAQPKLIGEGRKGLLLSLELLLVEPVRADRLAEEEVSRAILAFDGELDTDLAFGFADEEGVRDSDGETGTVAVARVGTGRTAVGHVAEEVLGVRDDLVRGLSWTGLVSFA